MKHSLLKGDLKEKLTSFLGEILTCGANNIEEVYSDMERAVDHDHWHGSLSSDFLREPLNQYKDCPGLGIDFPIWFDWETDKRKMMIIGRDPQRNHDTNELIIGSPFGLSSRDGRETKRNKYWDFVEPLLDNNRVYLTDIFKLFTKNPKRAKDLRKLPMHAELLKKEIEIVDPEIIVTIGKDSRMALAHILDCNPWTVAQDFNGREIIFVPHLSNMVLQNIPTIGDLFLAIGKLKNDREIEKVGIDIFNNRDSLF